MSAKRFLRGLGRRPLIVASLADHARLAAQGRRAAQDGADILEVRADQFPRSVLKPEALRNALRELRNAVNLPVLLTIRRGEEGGGLSRHFQERDRLALYRAGLSHAQGVDIELAANEILRHVALEAHKRGRFVVMSAHDYAKVPSNAALAGLVRKAKKTGGDILKVAGTPKGKSEAARLMEYCGRAAFRRRVFIVMGRLGAASRLDGFRWGSLLSYGYVGKPAAPGQFSVRALSRRLKPAPARKAARRPPQ